MWYVSSEREILHAIHECKPQEKIIIMHNIMLSDSILINKSIHLVGVGMPVLTVASLASLRGIIVTRGDAIIEGICFRNSSAVTGNGSGVWHDGEQLVIKNCRFEWNQNGVMIARSLRVAIENSIFNFNGGGCGHTHGIYITSALHVEVKDCTFLNTLVGHHVKSRAQVIEVVGCYFGGDPSSSTSCAVELAKPGLAFVSRNQLIKQKNSMSRKFISVGSEGNHQNQRVLIEDNIFIAQVRNLNVAVMNYSSEPVLLTRNAYEKVTLHRLGAGYERDVAGPQVMISRGLHGPNLDERSF